LLGGDVFVVLYGPYSDCIENAFEWRK